MTGLFTREFLAQGAIVLAVCFGAWMMFVEPRTKELAELEALINMAKGADGMVTNNSVEQLAGRVSEIRDRVNAVKRYNRLAEDSSQLYALVMDLADATGVDVQSMEPGESNSADAADASVRIVDLDVTISGTYGSVAEFVDRLRELKGFVRPASLQLMPRGDLSQPLVSARVRCEVLSFKLPETLAAMGGDADA